MKASKWISHHPCDFSELLSPTGLDSRSSRAWGDSRNKICSHRMHLPSVSWLKRSDQPPDEELRTPFAPFSLRAAYFSTEKPDPMVTSQKNASTFCRSVVGAVPDPAVPVVSPVRALGLRSL